MGFFKNLFKKYGGVIDALNLEDFWDELSKEEKEKVRGYSRGGLSGSDRDIDHPKSTIKTNQTAGQFLNNKADFALTKKDYYLAEKLLVEAANRNLDNPIDLHYSYSLLVKLYHKLRGEGDYLEKCIKFCKKDIKLYEEKLYEKIEEKRITSFEKLAIIYEYEKADSYEKAVEICKKAIKYNLKYENNNSYKKRLRRLKSKINKNYKI